MRTGPWTSRTRVSCPSPSAKVCPRSSRWTTLTLTPIESRAAADSACSPRTARNPSRDQRIHHLPRDVRQSEIAPLIFIRQPRVVESQQLQHRGVEIVHVDLVLS